MASPTTCCDTESVHTPQPKVFISTALPKGKPKGKPEYTIGHKTRKSAFRASGKESSSSKGTTTSTTYASDLASLRMMSGLKTQPITRHLLFEVLPAFCWGNCFGKPEEYVIGGVLRLDLRVEGSGEGHHLRTVRVGRRLTRALCSNRYSLKELNFPPLIQWLLAGWAAMHSATLSFARFHLSKWPSWIAALIALHTTFLFAGPNSLPATVIDFLTRLTAA
ncbi:hypothetical protein EMCRGX_G005590 [Ephydatia muelleri]